jgi:predicted negative regulator of RcsB-dependent stress response
MIEEIQKLAPLLAGPVCGLIVLVAWVYFQRKDADEMKKVIQQLNATIQSKDAEILAVAKEAIACITNTTMISQSTQARLTSITQQLNRMEHNQ